MEKTMVKIYRSCRKMRKTKKDIYKDAMKKFRQSIKNGEWKREGTQPAYQKTLRKWKRAGKSEKEFVILGPVKALEVLKKL